MSLQILKVSGPDILIIAIPHGPLPEDKAKIFINLNLEFATLLVIFFNIFDLEKLFKIFSFIGSKYLLLLKIFLLSLYLIPSVSFLVS